MKKQYRVRNWRKYEAGLRSRGSLTVWISKEELGSWLPTQTTKRRRGGQEKYSKHAIETALTVGMVFHLPVLGQNRNGLVYAALAPDSLQT